MQEAESIASGATHDLSDRHALIVAGKYDGNNRLRQLICQFRTSRDAHFLDVTPRI
jgi:hypothetical protein